MPGPDKKVVATALATVAASQPNRANAVARGLTRRHGDACAVSVSRTRPAKALVSYLRTGCRTAIRGDYGWNLTMRP